MAQTIEHGSSWTRATSDSADYSHTFEVHADWVYIWERKRNYPDKDAQLVAVPRDVLEGVLREYTKKFG